MRSPWIASFCVIPLGQQLEREVRLPPLPLKWRGFQPRNVYEELVGFHKGDIVLVKDKWEKMVLSLYSGGYLAFTRVDGEPVSSVPAKCRIIEKAKTIRFVI